MHGFAWLLNDLVFNNFWAGFFVEAGIFLLIGAGAGLFAWRSFKRAAPPTPDMAIEEAKEIKAAFAKEDRSECEYPSRPDDSNQRQRALVASTAGDALG